MPRGGSAQFFDRNTLSQKWLNGFRATDKLQYFLFSSGKLLQSGVNRSCVRLHQLKQDSLIAVLISSNLLHFFILSSIDFGNSIVHISLQ